MATYTELHGLRADTALLAKIEVACWVACDTIRTEDAGTANHANRLKWAKAVLEDPKGMAYSMLPILLAQNKSATVAAINGATDASIQSAVANAIDIFATGT